jgi:hypothetical protein
VIRVFEPIFSTNLKLSGFFRRAFQVNELDTKKGFSMEWLEFGGDVNAMAIVAAIAVIGVGIFFFTRKNIE